MLTHDNQLLRKVISAWVRMGLISPELWPKYDLLIMRADFRQKVPKIRMVRISPELWPKYDLLMMRVVPKIHMGRIPPKQSRNLMFNDIRANFRQKAPKPKFDHCIPDPKIDSSLVIEFSLIIIMGSRMPKFDHS